MFEYKWIRQYIALSSDPQIKNDLIKRTKLFNMLGKDGWKFIPLSRENYHFCFCREKDDLCRKNISIFGIGTIFPVTRKTRYNQICKLEIEALMIWPKKGLYLFMRN